MTELENLCASYVLIKRQLPVEALASINISNVVVKGFVITFEYKIQDGDCGKYCVNLETMKL